MSPVGSNLKVTQNLTSACHCHKFKTPYDPTWVIVIITKESPSFYSCAYGLASRVTRADSNSNHVTPLSRALW